ncbi:hypothetical protein DOK_04748 [gamma proteobacterium BDW918]|uniref:Uncharacterized protein n=1 Tax=Zhongshania aliphaticivorans TaxID=1470434 RepID=A0A127M4X4_9GAMM|nr:hypothetical protein [Zhongshania aliphaticivorans]AMO68282.1 hypothetical protein AZF00_08185 [Zhongshania aliphaticivorans]EIF44175.1 hypothetical protein DOK_04748 [gamma proteobacterium BDW918]
MERTLFIFEGEKTEKLYFQSLEKAFFNGEESRLLASFRNDIYDLYAQIDGDEDLDLFQLVKELNPNPNQGVILEGLRRDQIGQIYLFFDFEPQDNKFNGAKLLDMLARFDNETDNGKLFISYPMIEAIRDINDPAKYLALTVNLGECKGRIYKRLSANRGHQIFQDAKRINKLAWQLLIEANLKKANMLINEEVSLQPIDNQQLIAQAQIDRYLPVDQVAVLSAFPIFLVDYFGLSILE